MCVLTVCRYCESLMCVLTVSPYYVRPKCLSLLCVFIVRSLISLSSVFVRIIEILIHLDQIIRLLGLVFTSSGTQLCLEIKAKNIDTFRSNN